MSSIEWETPQILFDTLNDEFGFTIDVCANDQNAKCSRYWTQHHDALDRDWAGEIVWMNPPYDKTVGLWVRKGYRSSLVGATVVCLLQTRGGDTEMWHKYVMKAAEWRFIRNRLHFTRADGLCRRANISSVVVIFRPQYSGSPIVSGIDTKGIPVVVPA